MRVSNDKLSTHWRCSPSQWLVSNTYVKIQRAVKRESYKITPIMSSIGGCSIKRLYPYVSFYVEELWKQLNCGLPSYSLSSLASSRLPVTTGSCSRLPIPFQEGEGDIIVSPICSRLGSRDIAVGLLDIRQVATWSGRHRPCQLRRL